MRKDVEEITLPDIKSSDLIVKASEKDQRFFYPDSNGETREARNYMYEVLPHFCPQCGYLVEGEHVGFYYGYQSALLAVKIMERNDYRCFRCMMTNAKRWVGRWYKQQAK